MCLTVAIVVLLIILLVWQTAIENTDDVLLANFLFNSNKSAIKSGTIKSGTIKGGTAEDGMLIWVHDTSKLIIDKKSSMPVRLSIQLDPINGFDIVVPSLGVLNKRLARMCNDSIGYNLATFQFDIKDTSVARVVSESLRLQKISMGESVNKDSQGVMDFIDFKKYFIYQHQLEHL